MLARCRSLVETLSSTILPVGGVGAGKILKIVNQVLAATSLLAIGEAFALGEKAGADPKVLYDLIRASSGCSRMMDLRLPGFLCGGTFEPGSRLDLMKKDVDLAIDSAKALGVPLHFGGVVSELLTAANAAGHGERDFSIAARYVSGLGRMEPRAGGGGRGDRAARRRESGHSTCDQDRVDAALVEGFRTVRAATVQTAAGQTGMMTPAIRSVFPEARVCGPALAVMCRVGGGNLMIREAVTIGQSGDVLVVTIGDGAESGAWGEILTAAAQARGIAGLVIDGAVRDGAATRRRGLPVFSRGLAVGATTKRSLGAPRRSRAGTGCRCSDVGTRGACPAAL